MIIFYVYDRANNFYFVGTKQQICPTSNPDQERWQRPCVADFSRKRVRFCFDIAVLLSLTNKKKNTIHNNQLSAIYI